MAGSGNRAERRRQAAKTAELTEALAHHRAGRLDRAEALYRKFLEKSPGHADALHLLGIIALARGDPDRAIRLIGQALTARPDFAEGHSNLGNAVARPAALPRRPRATGAPSQCGPISPRPTAIWRLFWANKGISRPLSQVPGAPSLSIRRAAKHASISPPCCASSPLICAAWAISTAPSRGTVKH